MTGTPSAAVMAFTEVPLRIVSMLLAELTSLAGTTVMVAMTVMDPELTASVICDEFTPTREARLAVKEA